MDEKQILHSLYRLQKELTTRIEMELETKRLRQTYNKEIVAYCNKRLSNANKCIKLLENSVSDS